MRTCPNVFVPGEDEHKPGVSDGYDFGFLHIKAIDDAGHDKASVFKVKGLEAVDKAIGQLARLLWEAESTGHFQFFLCVTGDHSTPVEYGDHSFEPVPFTLCRLKDYVGAVGGESVVLQTSLDTFPLPTVETGDDLSASVAAEEEISQPGQAFSGDSVWRLNEIAAAREFGKTRVGSYEVFRKGSIMDDGAEDPALQTCKGSQHGISLRTVGHLHQIDLVTPSLLFFTIIRVNHKFQWEVKADFPRLIILDVLCLALA
ncbi:hypothetical protein L1987_24564 [Smallanthus sonchifolius]|uniref:Uncharacterized protein n=1 Tax=Smallanthus sonchifolius TaxID=185202 RepID=A0ACB9IKZ8_9ASTR|nr:hypothetical protein L1987_24564 [Smallanthus sonchifolius]